MAQYRDVDLDHWHDIDRYNLVEEWERFSSDYHKAVMEVVDCARVRASAKRDLEETEAELNQQYREEYEGDKRITEKVVHEKVIQHQDYKDSANGVEEAEHQLRLAEARRDALDRKKEALRHMTSLMQSDWYAEVSAPSGLKRKETEQGTNQLRQGLNDQNDQQPPRRKGGLKKVGKRG